MMIGTELAKVRNYLEETRQSLLLSVQSFPEDKFFTAPGEGCWSAAEALEHIAFVEGRALGRVQAALLEPADPSGESSMAGRDEELFTGVARRLNPIKAPPFALPTGAYTREKLIASFETAREATMRFAEQNTADLRAHFAPHPFFGDLDCYQWLMLIPSHGERHRAQIEECRQKLAV